MEEENKINCEICCKLFTTRKNMYQHVRRVHKLEPNIKGNISCPEEQCNVSVNTFDKLRSHLEVDHCIKIIKEEIIFPNKTGYLSWKEELEREQNVSFTCDTITQLKNGNKKTYLRCHRSGSYNSSATLRIPNSRGTCKIGKHCPATIEVVETENNVKVTHFKTHIGHDIELKYMKISEADKEEIQRKLGEGVPLERILDDVRNCDEIKRLQLLTRRDILNIKNSCSSLKPERLHKNDTLSVYLFVKNMEQFGDESPVIFYKSQDTEHATLDYDDFMLILCTPAQKYMLQKFPHKICIDTTHGTNQYDFNLTSLMVVDEFNRGFPSAFCISNKISEKQMTFFFNILKEKVSNISAQVFMSDDFPAYYNAWKTVMGEAGKQLLCIWHVDKNWRQALNKIKNTEKKVAIYKFLRTVLEETDENKFELLLNKFITELETDYSLNAFTMYFKQHYVNRTKVWAYCHRKYAGINTNMYLESLHKVLKHIYMRGKKNKRLDTLINLLLKLTKDKSFERYVRLIKGTAAEKSSLIHARHKESCKISKEDIKKNTSSEWIVQSQTNKKISYNVKKMNSTCTGCELNCNICNICLHEYSCTCIDCCVHGNMCKHIHVVVMNESKNPNLKRKREHEIIEEIEENELNLEHKSNPSVNTEQNKIDLKHRFSLGLNLIETSDLSDCNYNKVKVYIDKALSVLQSGNSQTHPKAREIEPANKNLPLQRLYSTKKKRKITETTLSKPSLNYKQAILDTVDNNSEMLAINCGDDHLYIKSKNVPE